METSIVIDFSPEALADLAWLWMSLEKFGQSKLDEVADALEAFKQKVLNDLTCYPFVRGSNDFRRCRFHRNMHIYYRYYPTEHVIEITRLFDTRQNPQNLKLS